MDSKRVAILLISALPLGLVLAQDSPDDVLRGTKEFRIKVAGVLAKLEKPAAVTILHNGVVTQNHTVLIGDTPHKKVGTYSAHPLKGPIKLQDHGNPMRFRNIWIRELKNPSPEDIGTGPEIGK